MAEGIQICRLFKHVKIGELAGEKHCDSKSFEDRSRRSRSATENIMITFEPYGIFASNFA